MKSCVLMIQRFEGRRHEKEREEEKEKRHQGQQHPPYMHPRRSTRHNQASVAPMALRATVSTRLSRPQWPIGGWSMASQVSEGEDRYGRGFLEALSLSATAK
jgi:hypothetical protein